MTEPILKVTLPIALTNGNEGRGGHWYAAAKRRKQYQRTLAMFGNLHGMKREPFPFPVRVVVTRVLAKGQRLFDSSSLGRGNWKEIEDSLVACRWFHDDGPKWITQTEFKQFSPDVRPAKSNTIVEVFQA